MNYLYVKMIKAFINDTTR